MHGTTHKNKAATLFWLSILLCGICTFCTKKSQLTTSQPKEFYVKPAIDTSYSVVNVLATFSVPELEKKANANIPDLLYEDNNIEDDNYAVKVIKKGGLKIIPKNNLVEFRLPVRIEAKARLNLGFFKSDQEANFELIPIYLTKLSISPDWKIITHTSGNGYQWLTKPKIKIGPMDFDVTSIIEKILDEQQDKIALLIDQQVAENIDLKQHLLDAWKLVQTPIPVSDEYNAWLKISPKEVYFIPPKGDTLQIKTGIGIKGVSETFIGEKPTPSDVPLPAMKANPASDNSFHINLVSKISFANASLIAKANLAKQDLSYNQGKYTVKLDDIDFYGSGTKLTIKAKISGSLEGLIYLSGVPYYDSTAAAIKMKNLDYTLDTKNQLLKTADWLAHGNFVKKLEKSMTFPIGVQKEEAKVFLQKLITKNKVNPYTVLDGKIESINPKKMYIVDDYFLIEIAAKGLLDVNITGF